MRAQKRGISGRTARTLVNDSRWVDVLETATQAGVGLPVSDRCLASPYYVLTGLTHHIAGLWAAPERLPGSGEGARDWRSRLCSLYTPVTQQLSCLREPSCPEPQRGGPGPSGRTRLGCPPGPPSKLVRVLSVVCALPSGRRRHNSHPSGSSV